MRASVCASTADVGSTRTRISGSDGERAGQHQPLALAAGEGAAALGHLGLEAVGQRVQDVVGRGRREGAVQTAATADVEPVGQPAREEGGAGVGDDDALADLAPAQLGERDPAEPHVVVGDPAGQAEPVGEGGGVVGLVGDDGQQGAGADPQAGAHVVQVGADAAATAPPSPGRPRRG